MEDTLRVSRVSSASKQLCLNPCFNGRYSQRKITIDPSKATPERLNPCFNGRYSQSCSLIRIMDFVTVLILVLMEDTLREFITSKSGM